MPGSVRPTSVEIAAIPSGPAPVPPGALDPAAARAARSGRGWELATGTLDLAAPLGAGIVNVTSDSFYRGARSGTVERAVADGLELAEAGFDLLDVGAVAARAGEPVDPRAEAERLVPAVGELAARSGVPVCADTFSAEVAAEAIAAGASAINDISGGADPELWAAVAEGGAGYVLMHIEGPPRVDRPAPHYEDVVDHLKAWFDERITAAAAAGIPERRIAIDPGADFDLTIDDDVEILRRLPELAGLGAALYVAISRKDFLGAIVSGSWGDRVPPEERGNATLAAAALAVVGGADVLRLHDVEALDAMRLASRALHG